MRQLCWIFPQTPVSDNDLSCIQTFLNQPLPDDFKDWLLKHNGAAPEPSELSLEDEVVLVINCFVSFSHDDTPNVFSTLEMLSMRLPDGLIPIAEDHGGNYVCLRYNPDLSAPDVVLWLHEEADPKHAIALIAPSFTGLIKRLREGVS